MDSPTVCTFFGTQVCLYIKSADLWLLSGWCKDGELLIVAIWWISLVESSQSPPWRGFFKRAARMVTNI
jgi:hypothetical protein